MSLKDEMLEEVEAIVEKLVAERGSEEDITLSEIEEAVLKAGQKIEAKLTAHLVRANEQNIKQPDECPGCGGKLRNKGKRAKEVVTKTGEVTINRSYYYCELCEKGIFPPG